MPRIPLYEEQVATPRNNPRTDVYQAPRVEDTSAGLRQAANAIGDVVQQENARRDTLALMEYDQKMAELDQRQLLGDEQNPGGLRRLGRNAAGVTNQTLAGWDKEADALTPKLRSPAAQAEASRRRAIRRQDAFERLSNHEYGQAQAADTDVTNSTLQTYANEALGSADDAKTVEASLARGRDALFAHGKRMGWDQAVTIQKTADWESGTIKSVIASQLTRDPLAALATFKAKADHLAGGDRLAIETALKPYVLDAQGRALGASLYQGGTPTVAAGTPSLYDAIALTESGDKQFASDGSVIRGPRTATGDRAVGRFQIMPATGPEAAALAGQPWDPKKFENDEVYHAQLGRAYIDAQVERFGGNVAAIAAAYNMGPEAAAAWVEGKPYKTASGKQWTPTGPMDLANMPTETRDYIGKVVKRMGGEATTAAPPADPRDAVDHSEAAALARAYNIADPDERDAAMQDIRLRAGIDRLAIQERERASQAGKAALDDQFKNAVAKLQDGVPVPLSERPTRDQLVAAHGETQGENLFQEMQMAARVGPDVMLLRTATPADAAKMVASYKPKADSKQYALDSKAAQIVAESWNRVQTQRHEDPMLFAAQNRLYNVQPINTSQPDGQWKTRDSAARLMSERYGTPYKLLSQDEAAGYSKQLAASTAAEKLSLLSQTRQGLTDRGFQSVMGQVAADQPLTAAAGSLLGVSEQTVALESGAKLSGAQVATTILAGQELLTPAKGGEKIKLVADSQLAAKFNDYIGDAYRGQPVAQNQAFEAFRAYYAAKAGQKGLMGATELNPEIAEEAALAVTGGVAEINDSNLVLPWGVTETQFQDQAERVWPDLAEMAGLPKSMPFSRVQFAPAGGDRYYVMAGETPIVNAKNGAPLIMVIGRPKPSGQGSTSALSDTMSGYGF